MNILLSDLALKLGATIHIPAGNDALGSTKDLMLTGIGPIDKAKSGDVTFLINPEYLKFAATTAATVIIVGKIIPDCTKIQLVHEIPYWAFATTFQMFVPDREETKSIDPRAAIGKDVKLGKNITIYAGAFVSDQCEIGNQVVLFPGVYLGRGVKIGNNTILRANVVIEDGCKIGNRVLIHGNTTIGADGFGFAPGKDAIAKIPQIGIVRIEDDVEIGGGTTIDRAAMGETVIGKGCKLDSSCHVAHNVRLGENTMMCGGAFVAGSAKVGNWVVLAGHTSVNNHIEIGDHITIGALAGVTKSIKEPGEYMGFPAIPANEWRREIASIRRLKFLQERVRKLEEQLVK